MRKWVSVSNLIFSVMFINGIIQNGPGLPAGGYPKGLWNPSVCSIDDDTGFVTAGYEGTAPRNFLQTTWKYNFTSS